MGAVFKCILAAIVVATAAAGPPPSLPRQSISSKVELGTAGGFAILAKSGITNTPSSIITGNIGCSPIASTAMTGLGLLMDSSWEFSVSNQITGKVYAASYATPTPSMLTTAISDMETAYSDAAGRPSSAEHTEGSVGGTTFTAGVHTWGTHVNIDSDITITGKATEKFIFQISGNLIAASNVQVLLSGGAKADNIVWQVAGHVIAGVGSHLEGIILVKAHAVFMTGASINGRILAQTACTLGMATVTEPPLSSE
jgi:hypothetical protein